jgi:anthranilate/para-aminobenzoate synthase component I
MILVDLEYGDLGWVCYRSNIKVDKIPAIKGYSSIVDIMTNVTGTLK